MAFKECGSNCAVKEDGKKGCPDCTGGFCTSLADLQQAVRVEVVSHHPGLSRYLQL